MMGYATHSNDWGLKVTPLLEVPPAEVRRALPTHVKNTVILAIVRGSHAADQIVVGVCVGCRKVLGAGVICLVVDCRGNLKRKILI